jgi:hypothetical protein
VPRWTAIHCDPLSTAALFAHSLAINNHNKV